jgi:hypothetical protein
VGWLNILGVPLVLELVHGPLLTICTGQIAGVSSTEFGLANMIWAAVVVAKV